MNFETQSFELNQVFCFFCFFLILIGSDEDEDFCAMRSSPSAPPKPPTAAGIALVRDRQFPSSVGLCVIHRVFA